MFYCNQVSHLIWTVVQWSGIGGSISAPRYRDVPQRGFQPDHLQYICFPLSLFFSTLHLALFTWHQTHGSYQKKTIPSLQCNDAGIDSARDTWFISSTYWAGLTIQQRASIRGVGGGVQHSGDTERLTLTSGPRSCNKFGASCPNRSAFFFFSTKNTSSICWIPANAGFSTIAWGFSIHGRVQHDTDPSYDAHPYLKGSVGDLWGTNFQHVQPDVCPIFPQITVMWYIYIYI